MNPTSKLERTALVVDDSNLLCELLKDSLIELGFDNVLVANDGKQAVSAYKRNTIHLTFLDLEMPKQNGIETLKEIKAINKDAYVVIVSGTGTADSVKKAIVLGAKGFIVKPCSPSKIAEAVTKFNATHAELRFNE